MAKLNTKKDVMKMARGKPIPGLEEAIKRSLLVFPGKTAVRVHKDCENYLQTKLLLSTVNSALKRLTKRGEMRKEPPEGKKVPFMYYLEEEGKEDGNRENLHRETI